nr:DUF418 domain-containing protein [Psychroflexus aurantiacus]
MFILFMIGLLHIILLWSGGVLHLYAILGLLVTLLIRASNRMLVILSVFFLLFLYYDQIFGALFNYLLNPLKYTGRMALTNCVMHSVFGLILFSFLGFGLYETLSPLQTIVTALAVFIFQIIYNWIWLRYFLYGSLEWVWRCLTYRKLLPVRKVECSEVALSKTE